MTQKKHQLAGAIALLAGFAIGCADDGWGWPFGGSIVFPAESYLGGTVAVAISSNYIANMDRDLESYDYHRDNVEVRVFHGEGAGDYETAEIKTVFDVSPSRSSRAAIVAPGSFATIVVFDLPTALEGQLTGPAAEGYPCEDYPCPDVAVEVVKTGDGEPITFASVRVLGDQGAGRGLPSPLGLGFDSDPAVGGNDGRWPLDDALQPQTMIRLRAVHDDGIPAPKRPGFGAVPGQEIGAIEFWLTYSEDCMENLRVYPNSEAVGAIAMLGPVGGGGDWTSQKVVLVDPAGFSLDRPVAILVDGDPAGEGPLLDLAFDWIASCEDPLEQITNQVSYTGLLVTDLDGEVLIDQAGSANEFFTEHLVDLLPEE